MKTDIKKLIFYILLLVLLISMFVFNRRRVILFFITAMILYIISALFLFLPGFIPEFTLSMAHPTQEINEKNKLFFKIKYKDFFPFTRLYVTFSLKHKLENKEHIMESVFSVFHGEKNHTYDLSFGYCGIYEVSCKKIIINDLLGIFSRQLNEVVSATATVMPSDCGLRFQISRIISDNEEDIYSDPLAGEDVSEIKELRDYRDGDRLSQVHWKLSTKSEDLIVKEYARNIGVCIVIACDGSYNTLSEITAYYELLYSFGKKLIDEEIYFELLYYSSLYEDVTRKKIDNTYDLSIEIQNMYFHLSQKTTAELESLYNINGGGMKLLYLTMLDLFEDKYKTVLQRNNAKLIIEN